MLVSMVVVTYAVSYRLPYMQTKPTRYDAAILNMSRSYLMGFDTRVQEWFTANYYKGSNRATEAMLSQATEASMSLHPVSSSVAAGFGFLLSIPMCFAWLVAGVLERPKMRFYTAFGLTWVVFAVYHISTYQQTQLYSPISYEWALFPVLAFGCGLALMAMTPKRYRRQY